MKYIAKTLYGLENVLSKELESLGASEILPLNRAVSFSGNKEILYRANYSLRTALSVLKPISEFRIRSVDDLYKNSSRIQWNEFLDLSQTFSVVPVINSPLFKHSGYPGLVLKDAIADWFSHSKGKRPSVDTKDPDLVINLHISNNLATVSIDSSVIPLYKRGYRKEQGIAPINEVLAAGIILLSGWNAKTSLTDPMCGSGTIPIEAALIATGTPPGKFRNFFGFQKWKDYDNCLFEKVKKESKKHIIDTDVKIYGSDISGYSADHARVNVESASLSQLVKIDTIDFRNLKPVEQDGYLIMNPPYGQRIKSSDTDDLYGMIGNVLKNNFPGFTALIISEGREFIKQIGLKPSGKATLFNGSLECTLVKYELYSGSKKIRKE